MHLLETLPASPQNGALNQAASMRGIEPMGAMSMQTRAARA
jgi:hypothetical protein